ncbi:MAG: hypothetical protein ACRD2N_17065 [Vicinamibacterales bacterium]
MPDVGVIRKRVRFAIDAARRDQTERRVRASEAAKQYESFLESAATPAFRTLANVLKAEGLAFELMTPSGGVRLASDRNRDDAIELELDSSADPPEPVVTITRARGSRIVRKERPVKQGTVLLQLTEDDVVEMLLEELRPWLV